MLCKPSCVDRVDARRAPGKYWTPFDWNVPYELAALTNSLLGAFVRVLQPATPQVTMPVDRSTFYELASIENLLYTCPAHYMECEEDERVVIAIAGRIVPQLQYAIDTDSIPVLPTVAAILAGEFPEVAALLLSAPHLPLPNRIDAYYISIDMKRELTAACTVWRRDQDGQKGDMVLSVANPALQQQHL